MTSLAAELTKLIKLAGLGPVIRWALWRNGGDASGSGSEVPSQVVRPPRRARRRVCFDQTDRRPIRIRHPNTIAYPEKFFEKAQRIATHSHLRWPDHSREWIRRQQARIARDARADPVEGDVNSEPPAQNPPRKTTGKAKKQAERGQSTSLEGDVPLEETPSSVDASKAAKKKKKKKDNKKRSRVAWERPKKKAKKKAAEEGERRLVDSDRLNEPPVPEGPSRSGGRTSETGDGLRDESPLSKRAPLSSAMGKGVGSEGSLPKKARIEFPDRVELLYDEKTPLVLNPLRCTELTRQICGGTRELPLIEDLYFKDEYIDAASASKRSDGIMNYLVEKYESTLKHTMIQLGASEKLARTWLSVIERLRAENKKATDKADEEKEVLRIKFEELESKLKSDRLTKKEVLREKTRLERMVATLEKEETELEEERDAVVGTLVKEMQRLRDSRIQEVTRERVKVQTAMADKSTHCFGRECLDKNNPGIDNILVREEEAGDVAVEDPVLVSSSEEREDEEEGGDQEEDVSSPKPNEEIALSPPASDPSAQMGGPTAQVAEESVESSAPVVLNKNGQDPITKQPAKGLCSVLVVFRLKLRLSASFNFENKKLNLRVEDSFVRFLNDNRVTG
ncbi:hypothetical protein IGI04_035833 [Brassica rapa subsp. trilocularis]|uniref:Uncharacterized protein n=1 Tax=Brassica rapa subsp. trilocularis TaxID=1813537 RepID=A0ABQ7LCQ4_BRACM|nr:hypothetical protein IGI04_035833 [Brassica rapa subsp. trilocularis]